jgi:hypothetical protein
MSDSHQTGLGSARLYALRPGNEPADPRDDDLMGLGHMFSAHQRRAARPAPRRSIVVIALDASRYRTAEFDAIDVDWLLLESPMEALDHLLNRADAHAGVVVDSVLQGKDDGYRIVEALRTYGYVGPIFLATLGEPSEAERGMAKNRRATGIAMFGSNIFMHTLRAIAAGIVPVDRPQDPNNGSPRYSYPAWMPAVIMNLAKSLGPSAGEVARKRFVDLHARHRAQPRCMELVEEVADVLTDWPDEKARFIRACSTIQTGGV